MYLWMLHDAVWQKPTQHCKAIILQLKINKLKKFIGSTTQHLCLYFIGQISVMSYPSYTGDLEHIFLAGTTICACSVVSDSLPPHEWQPTRLLSPWAFSGKYTGVGCHCLLEGIFPTQGSNPHLLCLVHWNNNRPR